MAGDGRRRNRTRRKIELSPEIDQRPEISELPGGVFNAEAEKRRGAEGGVMGGERGGSHRGERSA